MAKLSYTCPTCALHPHVSALYVRPAYTRVEHYETEGQVTPLHAWAALRCQAHDIDLQRDGRLAALGMEPVDGCSLR